MFEIDELIILLNNYCNLRCRYCNFREDRPEQFIECTSEHMRKAITLFFENIKHFPQTERILCFNANGEVLLSRSLLLEGIQHATNLKETYHAGNVLIAVVTNGTLLDHHISLQFAHFGVVVTVSIDGDASVHDRNRLDKKGLPTHLKVVEGIYHLRTAGVPVSVRAVVSPETAPQIAEMYRFLRSLHPSKTVKLRPMRRMDNTLSPDEWVHEFTTYYVSCVEDLLSNGTPISELPDDAYHFAKFIMEGGHRQKYCGAGHSMLWMTPTGFFTTCGLFTNSHEMLGHIDDIYSLEDFLDLLNQPFAHRLRTSAPNLQEPCASCYWLAVCQGGCPALTLIPENIYHLPPLCMFYSKLGSTLQKLLTNTSSQDFRG